ncbi:MAG: Na+/H+ antiporter [uncultured Sulfurovum sp.]|uniref:Na+/H+ antiporter n=1 Tax=uncultured Sulfurovum sp. TaxID=269237 RepID=A0A6S6TW03_9BACT|nr:MAG: Na+/H+ antiporter [uncultured Sulfurovum sp.]
MEDLGFLSVLIPLFIIIMAIITKDVVVSLLSGIFLGELLLHNLNPFIAMIELLEGIVRLFSEGWITKTLIFALLVGAIIKLISRSGGVEGFVFYLSAKQQAVDSPKGALFLAYVLGIVIFIESSITALVAGTVARPLCDKNAVSRAKLAFVCDSTSAPICSLIPFNAWGALLLGLILAEIERNVIGGNNMSLLIDSILFNFYSLIILVIVFLVIFFDINIGSMRDAKVYKFEEEVSIKREYKSPLLMVLPILFLIILVPISLYYTGLEPYGLVNFEHKTMQETLITVRDIMMNGSGSTSVFYAVIGSLFFTYIYYILTGNMKHKVYFSTLYEGISDMIPIVVILILAFFIGDIIQNLGTAKYIATEVKAASLPLYLLPLLIFWVAGLTAFSTGTSWGTFSIMMPIALGLAGTLDLNIALMIGAVISGGIFGDHVSPISDTTIISSMAAGCDHIEHVRTQIPYALIGAFFASLCYLFFGYLN